MSRLFLVLSVLFVFQLLAYDQQAFDRKSKQIAQKFKVPTIDAKTLSEMIAKPDFFKKYVLVDVRAQKEFFVSHLKGAQNLEFGINDKESKRDKEIIFYCSIGYRSGVLAEKFHKRGYKVYNVEGGLFSWANAQMPMLDSADKATTKVHGYSTSWSRYLDPSVVDIEI